MFSRIDHSASTTREKTRFSKTVSISNLGAERYGQETRNSKLVFERSEGTNCATQRKAISVRK
jgi:hypothetical protein